MAEYVYNMTSYPNKGICLIIANETFSGKAPNRKGTSKDAERVQKCFGDMGFQVQRHDNTGAGKMIGVVEKVAKENHDNNACFVFVLMTHGASGDKVLSSDDVTIDLANLVEPFKGYNCPGLIGKPKVFIIEGGRGEAFDSGVEESDATKVVDSRKIPHEADIIYGFSTVSGYVSWRSPNQGSWYIQTLCGVLEEHARKETLLWILDRVNHMIAYDFQSHNKAHEGMKQMPQIVSQLTKQLYLMKK